MAQDAPKERKNVGLIQISVIDKLLAAEIALGPVLKRKDEKAWTDEYKALYSKFSQDISYVRTKLRTHHHCDYCTACLSAVMRVMLQGWDFYAAKLLASPTICTTRKAIN